MSLSDWIASSPFLRRVRRFFRGWRALPVYDDAGIKGAVWVRMRGAAQYRDLLEHVLDNHGPVVPCVIGVEDQPSGRYAGQPMLRAVIHREDGRPIEVGVVEARYRATDQAFFDAVLPGPASGWLVISHDSRDPLFGRLAVIPAQASGPRWPVLLDPGQLLGSAVADQFAGQASESVEVPISQESAEQSSVRWLAVGRRVQVTGDEDFASLLDQWLGGAKKREIEVQLVRRGLDGTRRERVAVWAFNQEIGSLGSTTSDRLAPLIDQIEADGCTAAARATIVRRKGGPQLLVAVGAPSRS